jgi:hypothetical protein
MDFSDSLNRPIYAKAARPPFARSVARRSFPLSYYRVSGIHTAGTVCDIEAKIFVKIVNFL